MKDVETELLNEHISSKRIQFGVPSRIASTDFKKNSLWYNNADEMVDSSLRLKEI